MKLRMFALAAGVSLLLTGCGWMSGSYVYVEAHVEPNAAVQSGEIQAASYRQLLKVLEDMVSAGTESGIIDISGYPQDEVESGISSASRYIRQVFPIGAYAVEDIVCEVGTKNGRPAIAVTVSYRLTRMEIQQIRRKKNMEEVTASIHTALKDHSPRLVMLVDSYAETDYVQLIQTYARENPQLLMELPQVSQGIYGVGQARVLELNFTYQNSRDALRQMQIMVHPVFEAAALYVSGDGSDQQKFTQLFSFLTERYDYQLDTSITPAYSLLCHGVGDSRAFAEVYAGMCRRAGLTCMTVTGTRDGEPWTWNILLDGGNYYHVDLLRSSEEGAFRELTDEQMNGYVWDYTAYPACQPMAEAETLPPEPAAEETAAPEE